MTRTSTHTYFTAGPAAPTQDEFFAGAWLVNQYGNMQLKLIEPERFSPGRLEGARVLVEFGYLNSDGEFVCYDNEASHSVQYISGEYLGAGSILAL